MIYLLAIIVALGVLVFVHELGHFLAAKLFGVRVERFSIGFPPVCSACRSGKPITAFRQSPSAAM